MIARARRSFPALVVSLLLAAPGLLATAGAAEIAPREDTRQPVVPARPQPQRQSRSHAARLQRPPVARTATPAPIWTDQGGAWHQTGIASWYGGPRWQGKMTASGVRYDENALTAAHAQLPIGSRIRVTVNDTGLSVVVVINDRPGSRRRVIDLSRAAAAALGITGCGTARVTLSAL